MLAIGSIVWGVRDIERAVRFWSEALNYRLREEPDEDWAVLLPNEGPGFQLSLKLVTSGAETHQRHHMDLFTSDQRGEVERLLAIGAKRVDWRYGADPDYVVLEDPDGNRFCVVQK